MAARRAALALADLTALPLRRAPHHALLARCWELRDNLTIYDVSDVAGMALPREDEQNLC